VIDMAIWDLVAKIARQPGDPLDFLLQATLGEVHGPPLATGENLFSAADARNLLRYGGIRADRDVLRFDPALSYGLTEFLRTLDALRAHRWSPRRVIPHGGHQSALAIAAGHGLGGNESDAGVFEPFGGFADSTPIVDGHVVPFEVPGIGVEHNTGLYQCCVSYCDPARRHDVDSARRS
jgi:L-alanine-DL-glutamate epimerase-like enolase superfamily enzyme